MRLSGFQAALLALALLAIVAGIAGTLPRTPAPHPESVAASPRLSAARERHILYGDSTGGGHLHGAGKPCKSEFPASWDASQIIGKVKTLAANDNIPWRREENGYHTAEQTVDGVRVRIVLDREGDDIITAYPVNVPRNPCPAR